MNDEMQNQAVKRADFLILPDCDSCPGDFRKALDVFPGYRGLRFLRVELQDACYIHIVCEEVSSNPLP